MYRLRNKSINAFCSNKNIEFYTYLFKMYFVTWAENFRLDKIHVNLATTRCASEEWF